MSKDIGTRICQKFKEYRKKNGRSPSIIVFGQKQWREFIDCGYIPRESLGVNLYCSEAKNKLEIA